MATDELFVGVDGGNTKTLAVVGTREGKILGWGRDGGSDIYQAKPEPAMEAMEAAIRSSLEMLDARATREPASQSFSRLGQIALSMAGADWPEDFELIRSEVRRRGLGQRAIVVNDGVGALRASSLEGVGAVIVCGTGGAVGARAPDGQSWHSSFWQEVQGSRHLADKALSAIYRAELRLSESTSLTHSVLSLLRLGSVEELLHVATGREEHHVTARQGWDRNSITHVLLSHADSGDAIAAEIVNEHGTGLADYAIAAARIVGLGPTFTLFLAGGVFRHHSRLLAEAIDARVRSVYPDVRIENSRFEPVVGAFLLALEGVGLTVSEPLLECVQQSLPPRQFFAT